jgi:hypothetical protein
MAKLYIREYNYLANQNRAQVSDEPGTDQTPVVIGAVSLQSAAFGANTRIVRIHTDAICSIAFGSNPTATTNTARMAANATEYFGVKPGDRVAVIANT